MDNGIRGISTNVGDVFPLTVVVFDVVLNMSESFMVGSVKRGLRTTDPGVILGSSSTLFMLPYILQNIRKFNIK